MGVDECEYSAVSSRGGNSSFFFFRNSTALDMRGIISFRYWYRQTRQDKTQYGIDGYERYEMNGWYYFFEQSNYMHASKGVF